MCVCAFLPPQEVLDAMHTDGGGHVLAYIAGHAHQGGYNTDAAGIHHRTLEAPLEIPPGSFAFGTVDVYDRECARCGGRDVALALRCVSQPPLLVMRPPLPCCAK